MNQVVCVGIDVASEKLDVYIDSLAQFSVYPNTPAGWEALAQALIPLQPHRIVLEPTGNFELGVLTQLLDRGLPVARVNAARVKDFAKAQGQRAKNDRIDARTLAAFGARMEPDVTQLPEAALTQLRTLKRCRDFLSEQVTALKHLIRSATDAVSKPLMEAALADLLRHLKRAEHELRAWVKQQPVLDAQVAVLESMPGIGFISAVAVLTELPELGQVSPKAIAGLAGLAPYVQESGKFKGQSRLSGGRARARKALYMPALVAVRRNPVLKAFYERLKGAGKPPKKALAACMRKLLCWLNAMLREMKPWQPEAITDLHAA